MNNAADAVALFQLTSVGDGATYVATVYRVADAEPARVGGRVTRHRHRIEWARNGVACTHHHVPAPLENAARDAFNAGRRVGVFHGVDLQA